MGAITLGISQLRLDGWQLEYFVYAQKRDSMAPLSAYTVVDRSLLRSAISLMWCFDAEQIVLEVRKKSRKDSTSVLQALEAVLTHVTNECGLRPSTVVRSLV